jgi:hypothetical protein
MSTLAINVHATVKELGRPHLDSGQVKQLSGSKKISVCQTNTAAKAAAEDCVPKCVI